MMNWTNVVAADKLDYRISNFAHWFHDLPRFNYTFNSIPTNFNITDSSYIQSLTTWGILPMLVLIIIWIGLATYYCCMPCCGTSQQRKPKRNACAYQTVNMLMVLLAASCIGVSLYGNEDVDRAISNIGTSLQSIDSSLDDAHKQIKDCKKTLNGEVNIYMHKLEHIFLKPISNTTMHTWLQNKTGVILEDVDSMVNDIEAVSNKSNAELDLDRLEDDMSEYEYIRWSVTIGVQCWKIVVCLLLFLAVLRLSKCLILIFIIFCSSSGLLFAWAQSALYFSTSIGVADFCYGMDYYLDSRLDTIENDVIDYYLNCNKHYSNPFATGLSDMSDTIKTANTTLQEVDKIAEHFYPTPEVSEVVGNLTRLFNSTYDRVQKISALLDCTSIHKSYTYAAQQMCKIAFDGLFMMLMCTTCIGVLFLLMIPCAVCLRANIRVRHYYIVDEDDPFLPPRSVESSETSAFLTYGRGAHRDQAVSASNRTLYGSLASSGVRDAPFGPPPTYDSVPSSGSSPDMLPYTAGGGATVQHAAGTAHYNNTYYPHHTADTHSQPTAPQY